MKRRAGDIWQAGSRECSPARNRRTIGREDGPMGARSTPQQFTREDRKRHRDKVRQGPGRAGPNADRVPIRLRAANGGSGDRAQSGGHGFQPAMRNAEVLAAIADPSFQTELGRFNIEINVAPRRLAEFGFSDVRGIGAKVAE